MGLIQFIQIIAPDSNQVKGIKDNLRKANNHEMKQGNGRTSTHSCWKYMVDKSFPQLYNNGKYNCDSRKGGA